MTEIIDFDVSGGRWPVLMRDHLESRLSGHSAIVEQHL
jgi:hypothetical protein